MKKKVIIVFGVILLAAIGLFFFFLPGYVGRRMNATIESPPYAASERAKALHKTLIVADLHADTLMWDRDLLDRGDWGHVDLPRLVEGNVAAQAFTVVTKTPRGMNIDSNSGDTDNITLLALAERWPVTSWINLTERALYQARRLHEASARSNGKLVILRTGQDVTNFFERRKQDTEIVGGFLGLEGAHALEDDLNNLDRLFDAGFRMIGLAHFFDNEMAGSAHGVEKYGLTDKGRELVWRMEEKRVFIDLAHASSKTIDDVLRIAAQPVIVSHTGVKGTCDNRRNLSDDQLKAIANNGGIVGIGFWDTAVCNRDAAAIARAIRHAANIMGVDHVALGSDYDGAVEAPFDATGIVQITDALLREGFNEDEIRKIMGENVIRTLQLYLP
ncbi:MAG TPA: dipeptidase [Blastocatellia bacterium]|nr:dipeptidase [Blastocatellia bacterium]